MQHSSAPANAVVLAPAPTYATALTILWFNKTHS